MANAISSGDAVLPRWEELQVYPHENEHMQRLRNDEPRLSLFFLFVPPPATLQTSGELPLARSGHCALKYKRQMLLYGGYDMGQVLPGMFAFDLGMSQPRAHHGNLTPHLTCQDRIIIISSKVFI